MQCSATGKRVPPSIACMKLWLNQTDGHFPVAIAMQPHSQRLDSRFSQVEESLMPRDTDGFEAFINLGASLRELELIVGPKARPFIAEVREGLAQAAAKRQEGDPNRALMLIRQSMEKLAILGSEVDAREGAMMRFLAERFTQALDAGDKGAAKEAVGIMRHKAGDSKDEPNSGW